MAASAPPTLPPPAQAVLAAARATAPGADIHHWTTPDTWGLLRTDCVWCTDEPVGDADVTVTWRAHNAYLDDSTNCCRACIAAAYAHALTVAHPDQITVEVTLHPDEVSAVAA